MSAEAGEHVMVVSHMRSGTHLLLDLLGNNLQPWQTSYAALGPLEIDDLLFVGRTSVRELRHKLDEAPRVVKTHAHLPSRDFFVWGEHDHDVFDDLCSSALVVYAMSSSPPTTTNNAGTSMSKGWN